MLGHYWPIISVGLWRDSYIIIYNLTQTSGLWSNSACVWPQTDPRCGHVNVGSMRSCSPWLSVRVKVLRHCVRVRELPHGGPKIIKLLKCDLINPTRSRPLFFVSVSMAVGDPHLLQPTRPPPYLSPAPVRRCRGQQCHLAVVLRHAWPEPAPFSCSLNNKPCLSLSLLHPPSTPTPTFSHTHRILETHLHEWHTNVLQTSEFKEIL